MLETTLQRNIKDRLEKKNLSVAEFERRAGLRHAVINILHGRSKNPSIHVAQAIAKELNCSVEDLLSEEEPTNTTPLTPAIRNERQPWNPCLAATALDAVSQYLLDNGLNPDTTEIFQCANEIYKYALNSPKNFIDPVFVRWITERCFIRQLT